MKTWDKEEFAALIGIDWADQKHDVCERVTNTGKLKQRVITHSPDAIEQWARELRERFDGQSVAVALELTKGPLVHALQRYDHVVLFPIQPNAVAKYRETWAPSGAKDDPTDAALIQEMLETHFDKMKSLNPQSEAMRSLQQLVADRRKLVDDQVRLTNRVTSALKEYFPQVLQWSDDKGTLVFCDFVQRYPRALQARRARRATLERFFAQHNFRIKQRYSGTAPVTKRSGKSHIVQWRYRCPTFLRQSFVEWAALTIPHSHWAAVYYAKQRDAGKDHNKAVRALAYRWTRVIFRCWQDGTKYTENTRLKTLRKAGSPLVAATEKYAS